VRLRYCEELAEDAAEEPDEGAAEVLDDDTIEKILKENREAQGPIIVLAEHEYSDEASDENEASDRAFTRGFNSGSYRVVGYSSSLADNLLHWIALSELMFVDLTKAVWSPLFGRFSDFTGTKKPFHAECSKLMSLI